MKSIVFTMVILSCIAGSISAQVKKVSATNQAIFNIWKKPRLDWPLLSFSTDSVYGMEVNRAYEFLKDKPKKRKVIVAVLDSGTDIDHEDLKANLWTNNKEIPDNGLDDDRNGYVDDIHGWNFVGKSDGTMIVRGVEERNRFFMLNKERYDELFAKTRSKREEKEFTRLRGIFEQWGVAKIYIGWEDARAKGDEAEVAKMEKWFKEIFERMQDDRPLVGDNMKDVNDRFYGNNTVWSALLHIAVRDHGTHVAGIIGAERGNGIGIDGVADNVELMIVRAVPYGDEYDKDVANAIRYATDNGANVINMSFTKFVSPNKEWVQKAMAYAEKKGVLLVCAAGNSSLNTDSTTLYPSPYLGKKRLASVLVVGASDAEGNPATFSNYGKKTVDVFAPGNAINSTISENKYKAESGTSMASPVVAGLAAMLMTYYPELSALQVKDIIMKTATTRRGETVIHIPSGTPFGTQLETSFSELCITGGIANAYEAVKLADQIVNKK